jgi:hypothetical protein
VKAAVTQVASANWAGYYANAANGAATKVAGAWVEPAVKCTPGTQFVVFWVGIDGAVSPSKTVEQIGTLASCSGGSATYNAWWELFPLNSIQIIKTVKVHPKDKITASVTFAAGKFTMSIADGTQKFSKTATQSGTVRNSAECIAERPTSGGTLTHLANFGVVTFSSCTATISGHTGGIGTFASVAEVTMKSTSPGHATLAVPSAFGATKSSFSVTWKKAN